MDRQRECIRIANEILRIKTLDTQRSDRHDFHEVAVWQVRDALNAAYLAGMAAADEGTPIHLERIAAKLNLSQRPNAHRDLESALAFARANPGHEVILGSDGSEPEAWTVNARDALLLTAAGYERA